MKLFAERTVVDERAARLVAGAVAAILVAGAAIGVPWVVPVVALGFVARVGWGPRFSPLARAGQIASRALGTPKWVAGSPKRFAQGIGASCLLAASALLFAGLHTAGWILVGIVVVCAALEAFIGFCVGCKTYGQLMKFGVVNPSVCIDCAPPLAGRSASSE